MKMPAPPESSDFTNAPAGSHAARCCRLIDLGTQECKYKGDPKLQRKLFMEFALVDERNEGGDQMAVGNRYTFSSSEKSTLRKHLESWRGSKFTNEEIADFDLKNVLGKAVMLSVVHTEKEDKTYANVSSLSLMPKGMRAGKIDGETTYLSLDPDEFEPNVYDSLSDSLKATIAKSPEFQGLGHSSGGQAEANGFEDGEDDSEIPF